MRSRPEPIRLWNVQHELCERSFQLIYCYNRHLHRNGWHVHADDGLVRAHALRLTYVRAWRRCVPKTRLKKPTQTRRALKKHAYPLPITDETQRKESLREIWPVSFNKTLFTAE